MKRIPYRKMCLMLAKLKGYRIRRRAFYIEVAVKDHMWFTFGSWLEAWEAMQRGRISGF